VSDEPQGIDDVMPDAEDMPVVSLIACNNCDESGMMYSTGPIRNEQWWDCKHCENFAKHRIILQANNGVSLPHV